MRQLKFAAVVLIGFIVSSVLTSCKDDKDEDFDPNLEEITANAKGISLWYWPDQGLETETVYLWINRDVIKAGSEDSEEYKYKVEANYMNVAYYPLTLEKAKELILDNCGMKDVTFVDDSPKTKALYTYVENNKSKYQYVAYDYGLILFNRTSETNY